MCIFQCFRISYLTGLEIAVSANENVSAAPCCEMSEGLFVQFSATGVMAVAELDSFSFLGISQRQSYGASEGMAEVDQ